MNHFTENQHISTSLFLGNHFCLMEKYHAAFVTIAKNAVTTLKNIVICSQTNHVPTQNLYTHNYIGYTPYNGFLIPVADMPMYEKQHGKLLKFAVWRDPVERLVSTYKFFILEKNPRIYFSWLNLYQDTSFSRFLSFTRFELGKQQPLYQDEHIRRQCDYYSLADVDYVVPIWKLNDFLLQNKIPLLKEKYNRTTAENPVIKEEELQEIRELYEKDYLLFNSVSINQLF